MEHTGREGKEIVELLAQVRWLLTGLRMAGIKDIAVQPTAAVPQGDTALTPELVQDIAASRHSNSPPRENPPAEAARGQTAFEELIPSPDNPAPTIQDTGQALLKIREDMGECTRCRLHSGRTHLVFGDGRPGAGLVFVGEGPGFDEDRQGRPFVGRAGKLLDKMIKSLGTTREEVYICNVVKCRPPNNRTPNEDEIAACSPFLVAQLQALQPRAICALGACSAQMLLATGNSISRLRGKVHRWQGFPLICTYHPAYLLRNPAQKAATWQDLLLLRRLLNL